MFFFRVKTNQTNKQTNKQASKQPIFFFLCSWCLDLSSFLSVSHSNILFLSFFLLSLVVFSLLSNSIHRDSHCNKKINKENTKNENSLDYINIMLSFFRVVQSFNHGVLRIWCALCFCVFLFFIFLCVLMCPD